MSPAPLLTLAAAKESFDHPVAIDLVAMKPDVAATEGGESAGRRMTVGDHVRLSPAFAPHAKYKQNMQNGEMGVIVTVTKDSQPYKVVGPRGDTFWYCEFEVMPAAAGDGSRDAAVPPTVSSNKNKAGLFPKFSRNSGKYAVLIAAVSFILAAIAGVVVGRAAADTGDDGTSDAPDARDS